MFVLTLFSFGVTSAFADSFSVSFDKQQYFVGDSVLISGEILDYSMPSIAMSIYDTDGKIISANNLEITENTFAKTITLDSVFYEKTGQYKIKFDYGQITENYFFTIQNPDSEPEIIPEETITPEIISLYTEKNQYADQDTIKIHGLVSSLDSPTVLIGIYDPFGMPAGFYFGQVDSDLKFFTSFLAKDGVNFRTEGTYSIKAHYAETEIVSFFEYNKIIQEIIPDVKIENNTDDVENVDEPSENTSDDSIDDESTTTVTETTSENVSNVNASSNEVSDDTIESNDSIDNTLIEDNSTTQNDIEDETFSFEILETNNVDDNSKDTSSITELDEQNNLSVEDIELGLLLNQITLECDSSTFTDIISYYDGMGPSLYRLCKFDSALNFFDESLIDNSTNVEVLVNQGSALRQLGHFSKAIDSYNLAIQINPDFTPAKNNKANALVAIGQLDNAISLYHEILNENPNSTTVRTNLEIALLMIPDFQKEDLVLESTSETTLDLPIIEKDNPVILEKEKPTDFFEELSSVFSNLGALFDFLN